MLELRLLPCSTGQGGCQTNPYTASKQAKTACIPYNTAPRTGTAPKGACTHGGRCAPTAALTAAGATSE